MKLSDRARHLLAARRFERRMARCGYEYIGEGGGRLWELYRGCRYDHVITAVTIAPDGRGLWVKIERAQARAA